MKKIKVIPLFISLALIVSPLLYAAPVTIETAKQVAMNLFLERYDGNVENMVIFETFIEKENSENIYYIFNFNQPAGGFVIISADDVTFPILGYCFDQNYGQQNHPPQFNAMLESYRKQIIYAKENQISATKKIQAEWERLKVKTANFEKGKDNGEVGPLLATTWNQNWPYNELCPADGSGPGGHAYAGCVATAMAQVMKYWSHPIQGTGSHDYTHYNYGYLSADFGATTYDWANMPHSISSSNIPIATLMYHCGVAVEMNYGASGSGANLGGYHGACNAFKNYFNYDLAAYFASKNNYEDSTWQNMLRNELDNGRPMVYEGWYGYLSGHAWNLDGYEAVGELYHYHMNWGWGGSYNGYYYLDDLTPGSHYYSNNQKAVFNLYPYAANLITCYPQNTNYWTGTTNPTTKTETSLVFGTDPEDGWISFDISAIPDGSTIYAVSFNGHVYERYKPNWSITPVSSDPITAGAGVLHADIVAEQSSGYYFHHDETIINYPVDWRTYMLEGDICADLQSSLSSDKITVGIANDHLSYTRYIRFDGWNETNPPFLNIYYATFGDIEGYVFEDGSSTPVEDVYITIGHLTDTTDVNGYYLIEDVPIGPYDVYIDANGYFNANGNPYFNDTATTIINDGITTQLDFGLKWAEIVLDPTSMEIPIDPYEIKTDSCTIVNDGPGDLEYSSYIEPPMGDTLANFDIESATGDTDIYGCGFDGTYIWATGPVGYGEDHQLYKLDKDGNLISQYSQGTTSAWGMHEMTFDGTYLYSGDENGFYRIDPGDGTVTTLFTDYPDDLSEPDGIAWVPGLGFVAIEGDEDFYVFDETGTLVTRLANPGENTYVDMTYDNVNNCLWLVYSPFYTIYQYDLETESLTGLSWLLPQLDGDAYQAAQAVFFTTDFVANVVTICGVTNGIYTPNHFFALEVESWLQITGNRYGTVEASSKGSLDVILEINAGAFTEPTKTADVVITHNAGDNSVLTVTITNNYITGSLSGYVTEFGNPTPIPNALLTINGQTDLSGGDGFYEINNIPNGIYDVSVTHNDFLNDTIEDISITGIPAQQDVELKWTDIDISPVSFNINLSPDNTLDTVMNITNTGTGDLIYNCEIVFPNKSKSVNILVVDRDMSCYYFEPEYADEWENYEDALDANSFSYTYHEVYHPLYDGPDLATMQQYDIIIWFTGEEYDQGCMTSNDENNLASYLDSGGLLFLSSQGYLTNYGWSTITLDPGEFPYDYLGLRTVTFGNWYVWSNGTMEGVSGSLAEGYTCNFLNYYYNPPVELSEFYDHAGMDLFNVTDPTPEGICAIQYEGNGFKSVFSTLSLASVEETCRANLLADIVEYLGSQWISITSNESGLVPGETKGSVDVGLLFNATGLTEGTYQADLHVSSNDLDSLIIIPVTLNVVSGSNVDLKVFLEGPFNVSDMNVDLNNDGLLPLAQPFNVFPWYYSGTEDVASIPNSDIVDWILVEYRDADDAASAGSGTMISRQATFLLNNGSIVGLDGSSYLQFYNSLIQQLFVVVWHRNHLGILSANPLTETDGTYSYDFTTDSSKVFGGETGYNEIASGIWGMVGSDGNTDGDINDADKNNVWAGQAGMSGYKPGDYNMDCNVTNIDKNDVWVPNIAKGTQVPD